MTALNTMVKKCAGLIDTRDVSEWESNFLRSIAERTRDGDDTRSLTEKQIDTLTEIYERHYA